MVRCPQTFDLILYIDPYRWFLYQSSFQLHIQGTLISLGHGGLHTAFTSCRNCQKVTPSVAGLRTCRYLTQQIKRKSLEQFRQAAIRAKAIRLLSIIKMSPSADKKERDNNGSNSSRFICQQRQHANQSGVLGSLPTVSG